MGEGGGGSGIGQIVSGHVDGLDGGNGSLGGGGNTLLHETHVDGQSGLVTDSGGNATKKGRHLGTGLSETENVVNEEQHILTLNVTEVLGDGQTSKGDTGTGTWGLVHLTEDKGDLGLAVKLNDGSLLHLVVQIVTLTGTLTDTSEDGETTVGLGDVVLPAVS
jgi:peptide chain release factor 1